MVGTPVPQPVLFGFSYPHHGSHAGFAALARALQDQCEVVAYPHAYWLLRFTNRLGLRRRGDLLAQWWFRCQERRVRRWCETKHRRVVHYFFPEDSLYRGAAWKGHHLLVATCHQPLSVLSEGEQRRPHRQFLRKLEGCDGLILMSGVERDQYQTRFPQARVVVIPHGVDTEFFSPGARAGDGVEAHVLTVGNWLRDYQTGSEAIAALAATGLPVTWTVVANKGLLPEIRRRLPQLGNRLRLLWGLNDAELREEYRRADVLFLPLRDAWANNALLEAMACALPVVVSDLPATREYLAGAPATYVPVGNAAMATQALQSILGAPGATRAATGAALRAVAQQRYDWQMIARQHLSYYGELLEFHRA